MKYPSEGETKRCVQCGEVAVYSVRVAVIEREGGLYRDHKPGPNSKYTKGWYCSNGRCDFTETLPSPVPS